MRNEFSTLDIVAAIGIPRERLRDWMNRGFVVPSISAKGQGTKAVFTRNDIYYLAVFDKLLQYGLKRKTASSLVRKIKQQEDLTPKTKVVVVSDGNYIQHIINFGRIRDAVDCCLNGKDS
jgi:hypothetical protein